MPQDKATEIKAWMAQAFAAYCDPSRIDEFHACFAPEFTNFYINHSLLTEGWMSKAQLQSMYDAGMKANLSLRHPNVQLYDGLALFTGYAVGGVTEVSGETRVGTWRFSAVIVPNGDGWQGIHNHWSKLEV